MLKQTTSVFITFIGLLLLTTTVFAQSDQELAKKYGITFPVKELGGCQNFNECKTYCDDIKNQDACIDFAQKKGFHKSETNATDEEILKLAKEELGCNSYDQCMAFCEREENMEKCMDFASKHNLDGDGGNAAQMKQVISTLKSTFGCSSMKSCMDFCNNPTNMERCMEVFKQAGFPVEVNYSGPGGGSDQNFNPEPPEVWCPKVGENCSWDGNQCTCIHKTITSPNTTSDEIVDFSSQCLSQPGCSWDAAGRICSCPTGDAAYECQKLGGVWDGVDCRSQVQGVKTQQGLLQSLLDFLLGR